MNERMKSNLSYAVKIIILNWLLQIHKHLIDLISLPATDAQAAAIGALYNLAEVNMDCRLSIACERW